LIREIFVRCEKATKEEEEREEELVQPGPRQSSDGSCPTDAAFGEMRRRGKRKKAEKER